MLWRRKSSHLLSVGHGMRYDEAARQKMCMPLTDYWPWKMRLLLRKKCGHWCHSLPVDHRKRCDEATKLEKMAMLLTSY